jgi:Tic22-like family
VAALLTTIAISCCSSTLAFAPPPITSQTHAESAITTLSATKATEYPPLSEAKIRQLLDTIPVYAVVDPSKEAMVLLSEKNNPHSLAYLSFSPTQINELYAPLRAQQTDKDNKWEITAFPLGLVWYDLLKNPDASSERFIENDIEYRLIPDPAQLKEARNLVQKAAKNGSKSQYFSKDYNEIPLFIDDYLRVQDPDGTPLVPIYLGLNDLLEMCQQAVDGSEGKYKASVNLSDLQTIISQMQQSSPTNFDQAILIPPSGPVDKASNEYQIPSIPTVESKSLNEIEVPVLNQWDD